MLYKNVVEPNTFSLIERLQQLPVLEGFNLAGGTALALKYGHRISIDIDLFGENFDKVAIINGLKNEFKTDFEYEEAKTDWAIFCYINNIKVDIIHYEFDLLRPIDCVDGISILNTADIAAMKITAILGRASKKDFWDLSEILEHYSLSEIIDFYKAKYPNQKLLISIPVALSYFDEADADEDPMCLKNKTWVQVKSIIQDNISTYLK